MMNNLITKKNEKTNVRKQTLSTASLILPWLNGNQKNFNNNHFPEQTTNRTQTVKKRAQGGKKESASREKMK